MARHEPRIVMAKEMLKISPGKVVVDYDFRNDTDQDVTTEVAFPIPPYENGENELPANVSSFSDFRLTIDGNPEPYETEARAYLKDKEVTSVLRSHKIDIATFGHWDWDHNRAPDFSRLPKAEKDRLIKLGLFDQDVPFGNWTVRLEYHWKQVFPAHSTVHIRHEYKPIQGFEMMPRSTIRRELGEPPLPGGLSTDAEFDREDTKLLNSFCPDPGFLRSLEKTMTGARVEDSNYAHPHWIDFILTSANTWRQPIGDFTLIIGRRALYAGKTRSMISFCSPEHAPVENLDADHFRVHLTDFVPKAELRIGYFDLPEAAPKQAGK